MNCKLALFAICVVVVVLFGGSEEVKNCDFTKLGACAPAILYNNTPTKPCCDALKEQNKAKCLCYYMTLPDPLIKKLIDSPAAKNMAKTCDSTPNNC
ncbi:hypothetical protein CASFOL_009854 [Castilleja foliolosa]|uniref:Bifunctional inhibitor/plant lipid transfer protein/seed storage helical domain-containing protein n=1 Tax=Castilleja foliolosa TaxID=1961234 RepID=A0ABD3DUI8_9LAMI